MLLKLPCQIYTSIIYPRLAYITRRIEKTIALFCSTTSACSEQTVFQSSSISQISTKRIGLCMYKSQNDLGRIWLSFLKVILLPKGIKSTKWIEPEFSQHQFSQHLGSCFRLLASSFLQMGGNRDFLQLFQGRKKREDIGFIVVSSKQFIAFLQHKCSQQLFHTRSSFST